MAQAPVAVSSSGADQNGFKPLCQPKTLIQYPGPDATDADVRLRPAVSWDVRFNGPDAPGGHGAGRPPPRGPPPPWASGVTRGGAMPGASGPGRTRASSGGSPIR